MADFDVPAEDYDEIIITAPSALDKGDLSLEENSYGFPFADIASGAKGTFITKCKKVKTTIKASGETWAAGDLLYYNSGTPAVTNVQTGTLPIIGHAQQDAASAATDAYIQFDGTIEGIRAAFMAMSTLIELSDTPADYGTNTQQLTTNGTNATTWETA